MTTLPRRTPTGTSPSGTQAAYYRKNLFCIEHPEWQIRRVYGVDGYWEATTDPTIVTEKSLDALMDKLESKLRDCA